MLDDGFFVILALLALFYLIGLPIMVFVLWSRNKSLETRLSTLENSDDGQVASAERVIRQDAPPVEASTFPDAKVAREPATKTPWQRAEPATDTSAAQIGRAHV